ncbi:MAG: DUF1330 domain-containing protein [Alphaproteobacteria bacterium]
MSAYIIARVAIRDREAYQPYLDRTPGVVAKYGGRFVVRGGALETLEGPAETRRVVVLAFDDMAAARRFYESADYQAIVPLRQAASEGQLILVEGVAGQP